MNEEQDRHLDILALTIFTTQTAFLTAAMFIADLPGALQAAAENDEVNPFGIAIAIAIAMRAIIGYPPTAIMARMAVMNKETDSAVRFKAKRELCDFSLMTIMAMAFATALLSITNIAITLK